MSSFDNSRKRSLEDKAEEVYRLIKKNKEKDSNNNNPEDGMHNKYKDICGLDKGLRKFTGKQSIKILIELSNFIRSKKITEQSKTEKTQQKNYTGGLSDGFINKEILCKELYDYYTSHPKSIIEDVQYNVLPNEIMYVIIKTLFYDLKSSKKILNEQMQSLKLVSKDVRDIVYSISSLSQERFNKYILSVIASALGDKTAFSIFKM